MISDERVVGVMGLRGQGRVWVVSIPPSSWTSLGVGRVLELWGIKGEVGGVPVSHYFSDFFAFLLFCCCGGSQSGGNFPDDIFVVGYYPYFPFIPHH